MQPIKYKTTITYHTWSTSDAISRVLHPTSDSCLHYGSDWKVCIKI